MSTKAKIPPKPDKPSKDVIYVDVDDEITGIIDKVENSPEKVVALVLPKRATSMQSTVNMKLLARSAKAAGKNPVLITSEGSLLPLAGAAGLHVAKNLQSKPEIPDSPITAGKLEPEETPAEDLSEPDEPASDLGEDPAEEDLPEKIDYKNAAAIGALAAAHEAEHPETIDLGDEENEPAEKSDSKPAKTPKGSKVKVPDFDRFRMLLGAGILAVIALIVFIILAIAVLPKAVITIQTTSEPISANLNLTASADTPALDTKTGAIPAKLETIDQTGTAQATASGQQNNGQKASGNVNLTAQACNVSNPFVPPSSIPAGTGINGGGVNFITQEATVFTTSGASPSGSGCYTYPSTGNTDIAASAAGSKYNLAGGTNFTVPSRSASGNGSTSGGTDDIVTILSQADVEAAKQKITAAAVADFTKTWEKKLTDQGAYVLTSTLKNADPAVTSSVPVGQPATTSTVTSKTTYTVLTVKKTDLSAAIQAKLGSQIDKTKQKLTGNFLDDATISVQSQPSPKSAVLVIGVDTTVVPIINAATVKKTAEGKKAGDIKTVIGNWPGVKDVDVKLSPFWVSKVPKKDAKVTVVIKEVKPSTKKSEQP